MTRHLLIRNLYSCAIQHVLCGFSVCYIVYTFFESFPLVYQNVYGFSSGSQGLAFFAVFIALLVVVPLYLLHFRYRVESKIKTSGMGAPEDLLKIGLFPCFITPIGLFIFGKPFTLFLPRQCKCNANIGLVYHISLHK